MKFIESLEEYLVERKSTKESAHNDKLEPCPLCGKKAVIVFSCRTTFYEDGHNSSHLVYRAACLNCGLWSSHRFAPYHAAMKWNALVKLIRNAKIEAG